MRRLAVTILSGALAMLASAMPAAADPADDCQQSDDPAAQRGACTAVIAAGTDSGGDLSWAYYNRAYAAYSLGDYQAVVSDLDEAVAIDPEYGKAYGFRCSAYIKLGDYDAALADCNQDVALRPDHATSYYNRALVWCQLDDPEAAVADVLKEWELAPSEVAADQGMLQRRGFYDGPTDGTINDDTLQALDDWAANGC